MHQNEVDQQINSEHEKFLYSVYKGKIAPPDNIIEIFKTSILAMPPFAHRIMFTKIKAICSKDVEELTNDDLANIIKVVLNISLERLYPYIEFEEMVEEQIYMDKFVICFNGFVEDFKQKLNQKRVRLQSLSSGINGGGLKLVN